MRARTFFLCLCLLACGCSQEKSTDQLLDDLKSSEERERLMAIRHLTGRKSDAARIVPALIEALKDKANDIRLSAAIGLGTFAEQARDGISALQQVVQQDRDARVRNAAGVALTRIDPQRFPDAPKTKAPQEK
jgi:HEAT repeat protein